MTDLCAVTIFGQRLEWTVSTMVLVLMLVQAVLIAASLLIFAVLMIRKYLAKNRQNILVTQAAAMRERRLTGITVDPSAARREFAYNDRFDGAGLVVTAHYEGESAGENVTEYTVEPPRMDVPGEATVSVRYAGYVAEYTIAIAEPERVPVGISVDVASVKREFTAGEGFEHDGLIVTMNYSAEPYSEEVTDYEVDAPDLSEAGEKDVTVRRGEFFAVYSVTVFAAPEAELLSEETPAEAPAERKLTGIELDLSVVKTDFVIGEPFDSTGLKVVACYDAEPTEEPVEDFTVEAPDLSAKGMVNVVVRYGEFTQSYPVFITEPRKLTGISLDTSAVRREFTVGEEFNSVGLIVVAEYDADPLFEAAEDFTVSVPDLAEEGEKEVLVEYCGMQASYTVAVTKPEAEPEPVAEPEGGEIAAAESEEETEEITEAGVLRYDRSFTARLIQSSDETKHWYTLLKNELLSYRKVKERMSWKRETFRRGRDVVARFGFRGKVLCVYLALDPNDYIDTKYKVEDVSANKSCEDTPCMYRIKNAMRVKRTMELIAVIMERIGAEKTDRIAEDYYVPYEGIFELVNKGLAKRIFLAVQNFEALQKSETSEEVASADAASEPQEQEIKIVPLAMAEQPVLDPTLLGEESFEGGTLRYDKSFKAKLIQSDDETKGYYTAIKNELLSYRKVHDRLSWKRETYKASGAVVARLSYRGNTLCIYLPLDPAAYADSRYKVEDVSANKSFVDTPCMFRLKNDKRLRLAADLIATVMEERGIDRVEHEEKDFYEPYLDIVTLIEQGLVRREVKSKEEESVFQKD